METNFIPRGFEIPILGLVKNLEKYCEVYNQKYKDEFFDTEGIAEDFFLTENVIQPLIWAIKQLLNCDTGRLDPKDVLAMLKNLCEKYGLEYPE